MPGEVNEHLQDVLVKHSSKTLKHIQSCSDDVCHSLQDVAHQQTKYTVVTILDEHEKTRETVREHSIEVTRQIVKLAKDVGIAIETGSRDQTNLIMNFLKEQDVEMNKKYNKVMDLLISIMKRLNCFSPPNCGLDDDSDVVSTKVLENGDVSVVFKTGNQQANTNTGSKLNKPNNNKIKFTMPCMHAMDPDCLKNFCRSRMNAGQSRFVCPKEGCDVEWRYEEVRQYCSLSKNEATEFETTLSMNYARNALGGVVPCPGCKSLCARATPKDKEVQCPHCKTVFKFEAKVTSEE